MNARYYDPTTGRFISQDSYRGDGERFWHLYAYCNGDPVNFTDFTGYEAIAVALGAAGKIALIALVVLGVVAAIAIIANSSKRNPDPYARPGQKNREES